MRFYSSLFLLLVMFHTLLLGCSKTDSTHQDKVELHIHAAASLSDAMVEIEKEFEKIHPEIDLILNFASSGTLQRQIEQGAPADLFLSASKLKFDALLEQGLIHPKYFRNHLHNELVVITGKKNSTKLDHLDELQTKEIGRISVGVPESVPAGQYAKETLEHTDLWTSLEDKIVYGKDVRQVLSYVESGNVNIGFVYATDAASSSKVKILKTIDSDLHTKIIYPIGIIKGTKHLEEAKQFYTFLQQTNATETFQEFGFTPIN